jgi:hypothetical protein
MAGDVLDRESFEFRCGRSRSDALAASLRPRTLLVELSVDLFELGDEFLTARRIASLLRRSDRCASTSSVPMTFVEVGKLTEHGVPPFDESAPAVFFP